MKSMARSLLKSLVARPAPVASKLRAVSAETSVKVLLPLLRQRMLCAASCAVRAAVGCIVT